MTPWQRTARLVVAIVAIGVAIAVVGLLLLYEYRRLSSLEGILLSVGTVLYGVLQFSEIGERLNGLGDRQRELYRFTILSLALGLRLSVLGAVVKLPLVRASREQFQRSMESVPGGAALSTLRADGVLVVRDPDEVTRRLPLRLRPFVWATGGRIRWRTVQTVIDAGYRDAFRLKHPSGDGATLPTSNPHLRLDYVFVPQQYSERIAACDVIRTADGVTASDHFPVAADLAI